MTANIFTLHERSCLCTTEELDLFSVPSTNISVEKSEYLEFFPVSAPNQVIEFHVPSLGPHFFDLRSSFLHIQAKIVRANGDPASTTATDGTVTHDKVIPVQSFATSLFQYVHVYLNQTLVSQYENYSYRSYLDIILNANQVTRNHTLSALLFEADLINTSERLDIPTEARGLAARFKETQGSTVCDMISPLFLDIANQSRYIINAVDIRIVLRQNTEDFRLLAASTVPHKHVVQLPKIVLYLRRVQVSPSVLLGIERRLQTSPATYLLRGVEIKTRTVCPGLSHVVFDDLYSHRVPSRLIVCFVASEAFQGSRERDPFKFEHFNLKTSVLDVGGVPIREDYDFSKDVYMKAYMNLIYRLNKKDVPFPKGAFSKDQFLLYYTLTPEREENTLCPIVTANVRLTLTFKEDLKKAITVIFFSETPRVLEINKDRKVKFVT